MNCVIIFFLRVTFTYVANCLRHTCSHALWDMYVQPCSLVNCYWTYFSLVFWAMPTFILWVCCIATHLRYISQEWLLVHTLVLFNLRRSSEVTSYNLTVTTVMLQSITVYNFQQLTLHKAKLNMCYIVVKQNTYLWRQNK